MHRNFQLIVLCGLLAAFGAACSGDDQVDALPTTTPRPTDVIPTATPTPLPPPTVTPFPTGEGPGSGVSDTSPETGTASDSEEGASTPSAGSGAGTPSASPTAAQATSSGSSNNGFPDGVNAQQRIFSADFTQGWPTIEDATANLRIVGGQYAFDVGPFDARFITTSAVNETNTYTQVEATPGDCPVESGYGLIFRFADANNYFVATIFCNNAFSIVAKVSGSIVGDPFPDGALPGTGDASAGTHRLGVLSVGDRHTLYFDGQVVASFDGAIHEQGDVALYAISRGESVIRVAFDNLEVWTAR